jgi:hypothetical protein
MKIESDNLLQKNDLDNYLTDYNFHLIEKPFSKFDFEQTEMDFNFFENSLINQNTLNINEDNTEDINDKLYFIGNKRKLDNKNNFTLFTLKNLDIDEKMSEFKNIEKKMSMSEGKIVHNEYRFDNGSNKVKKITLKSSLSFINKKIKEKYECPEEQKDLKLYVMKDTQASNSDTIFNRIFINKTLKEIFSHEVSEKCKKVSRDHNKIAINKLLNDKDEEKRNYFNKIFNLKFIDALKYLRGETEGLEILEGLEFDKVCWNKIQKNENYSRYFILFMFCYEKLWEEKKPRNGKKRRRKIINSIIYK